MTSPAGSPHPGSPAALSSAADLAATPVTSRRGLAGGLGGFAVAEVVAAVGIERLLIGMAMPQVVVLALQVIGGAAVYVVGAWLFVRPAVGDLIRIGRDAIGRRGKAGLASEPSAV